MTINLSLPSQPLGVWVERGASSSLIDLALGRLPSDITFLFDKEEYNSWHYWAQGPEPHLLWEYLRLSHGDRYDHLCSKTGEHPLHRLLILGSVEATKQWIAEGKWPGDCKREGETFWHAAAWSGKVDCLETMGMHFSTHNLNDKDKEGLTSAMIAVHRGGRDALMRWMFLGADPNVTDLYGRSLLHHVALYGDIGWFTEVQDMGGDDAVRNDKKQTPRDVLTERMRHSTQIDLDTLKRYWLKKYQEKILF